MGDERLLLEHALVADHRALLDPRGPQHVGALTDHAAPQVGQRPDQSVVLDDGPVQEGARFDHDVAADDGELTQLGAGFDLRVVADHQRTAEHRLRMDVGVPSDPHPRRDLKTADLHVDQAVEHIGLDPKEARDGADILPVATHDVAEQGRPGSQELREHVSRPVHRLPGRNVGEYLRFHDVDAGVDRVGEDLPPGRFLEEADDPAVVGRDDDPELQGVRDGLERDRDQRTLLAMVGDQRGQVDVGQRIPADHQKRVVAQRVLCVADAAGRPQRCGFGRVRQMHTQLVAVTEIGPDVGREELHRDHGLIETVPFEQPQHMLHNRPIDDGE